MHAITYSSRPTTELVLADSLNPLFWLFIGHRQATNGRKKRKERNQGCSTDTIVRGRCFECLFHAFLKEFRFQFLKSRRCFCNNFYCSVDIATINCYSSGLSIWCYWLIQSMWHLLVYKFISLDWDRIYTLPVYCFSCY